MIAISVATVATTWPTSHQVSYLAVDVDAILAEVSSCSTVEITTLKAQLTRLESAEANMASILNATQARVSDQPNKLKVYPARAQRVILKTVLKSDL